MQSLTTFRHKHLDHLYTEEKAKQMSPTNSPSRFCFEKRPKSSRRLQIEWRNVISLGLIHAGAVVGILLILEGKFKVQTLLYVATLHLMATFGITAGAHRYWAHRSYKANLTLRLILAACNTLAFQHSIYRWTRDHRLHHKFSDTDADPHNATRGFFFSHMGWLLVKKHPLVRKKSQAIDLSDLEADPIVMFQKRHYILLSLLVSFIIPTLVPWRLWAEGLPTAFFVCVTLRLSVQLHSTWLVNSAAHMWGMKPYNKDIRPCENKIVSILVIGEGWHNYHHAFPWDYRASEWGGQLNLTTTIITLLAKIGWAFDLKTASETLVAHKAKLMGDGSRNAL